MKNVKPVRIAVIGIGDRATELMRTMIATKDLSIRILCDPLDARLEDAVFLTRRSCLGPNWSMIIGMPFSPER